MSYSPLSILTRYLLITAVSVMALAPDAAPGDTRPGIRRGDWPQGESDAGHSSHNPSECIIGVSNVNRLQLAWSASLGDVATYATPIVANGRVFLGGGDGRLHAFDALTGAVLWTSRKEGALYVDSATIADGLVFASATYAPLIAFDAATGKVAWTSRFVTDLRAPATVRDHTLYVGAFDGTLYALDTRTGNVRWSAPGGCCVFDQAPVVSDGRVFQMRTDGTLTAYSAGDGAQLWTVSDFAVGTMAAVDGKLIFGHEPKVVARDQATGTALWSAPYFRSADTGSPAVADGKVFVETTLSDLTALDENTGAFLWSARARSMWGPSVANGVVYTSNNSGEWDAYDETDGTLLWSVTNNDGCFGPCANAVPVISRGMLYLAEGELRAYHLVP